MSEMATIESTAMGVSMPARLKSTRPLAPRTMVNGTTFAQYSNGVDESERSSTLKSMAFCSTYVRTLRGLSRVRPTTSSPGAASRVRDAMRRHWGSV